MSKNSFNDSLKTILGFELTQNQHEALRIYEKELLEWNENVNLTAIRDVEGIRVKHFLDSLTVLLGWERKDPPRANH